MEENMQIGIDLENYAKTSLVEEIRKEHEKGLQAPPPAKPVPKILYTDGEERVL